MPEYKMPPNFEPVPPAKLPRTIAEIKLSLLNLDDERQAQRAVEAQILAEIEAAIAADKNLSNDTKRKAARVTAAAGNKELQAVQSNLRVLSKNQALAQVRLDFYKDELKLYIAGVESSK
jgi:hypothetical protein